MTSVKGNQKLIVHKHKNNVHPKNSSVASLLCSIGIFYDLIFHFQVFIIEVLSFHFGGWDPILLTYCTCSIKSGFNKLLYWFMGIYHRN